MNLCSEVVFAKRYGFGCNFWDREGRKQVTPKFVPFSVSVLAVVTDKLEAAMYHVTCALCVMCRAFHMIVACNRSIYHNDRISAGKRHRTCLEVREAEESGTVNFHTKNSQTKNI